MTEPNDDAQFSPNEFAAKHLPVASRQPFINALAEADAPTTPFAKETSLIKNRLREVKLRFKSGISLAVAETHFEDGVATLTRHDEDDALTELVIRDVLQGNPLDEVRRAINRLSVVGEIFDSEVRRSREAIVRQSGYPEARIMFELENLFLALTGLEGDAEITKLIVETLVPLYGGISAEETSSRLALFAERRSADLRWLYERNRHGSAEVLLLQPGSLMVFERLEADPFQLAQQWQDSGLPLVWLEALAATYGQPITA